MQDLAWNRVIENDRADLPAAAGPRSLRQAFAPLIASRRKGTAHAIGQLGLSLDGRIALASGESRYINGHEALHHLHRVRALVDAVLVGAGTVLADDPALTVRHCPGPNPARVVIDPNGRVGADAKVWSCDGARCIVFGGAADLPDHVERWDSPDGPLCPRAVLAQLRTAGLVRVLIEGGADTLGRFMAAGAINELHLLYGRVILGSGKSGLSLPPLDKLADAARPETTTHVFDDGDFLVACRFVPADQSSGGSA
jgi:riboflavin-specific deaminase-like protein